MRKHVLKAAVAVSATMLGATVLVAQPAAASAVSATSATEPGKAVKRSDVRACKDWKPAAKGLVNVIGDIVVEDKNPTRALRKKVLRYAAETREASATAKTRNLRIGLRHAAEEAEAWVDTNLDFFAAEDLVDEMTVPLDRCLDLS